VKSLRPTQSVRFLAKSGYRFRFMLEVFSRKKLERQGLTSVNKRRKIRENEFRKALHQGVTARASLFSLFTLATVSLILLGRHAEAVFSASRLQSILVVGVIVITMAIHLSVSHAASFARNNRVALILSVLLAQLLAVQLAASPVRADLLPDNYRFLLPAYALAPMILSLMLGRNHGIFGAIYASLLGAMLVDQDYAFVFAVMGLVSGFVAVYFTHQIRRRSKIVSAGFVVGLATTLLAFVTGALALEPFLWSSIGWQCLTTILVATACAMLISGALPLLESLFGVTTDISWIEMADLNHPLLKRLASEAPGTYHHSLQVARLSEAAAEAIGANETLCRVASYFHDIGKLKKPDYFIENITNPNQNPHDELTPTMSALIITAHVKEGVDLALKYNLNDEIIDVIREHHGTSIVQYFYHRALDQRRRVEKLVEEGKANEEDLPAVEEKGFRYPGPKPRSRESGIISLADSIESASRTLQKPTPTKIKQLIEELTEKRFQDGQLANCELTLVDLARIQKSFSTNLCSMMHNRIAYPGAFQLETEDVPAASPPSSPPERAPADKPPKLELVKSGSGGKKSA